MKYILVLAILGFTAAYGADTLEHVDPFSDEFIDEINKRQTLWKAGRNFPADSSLDELRYLAGTLDIEHPEQYVKATYDDELQVPDSFDAREQWPKCPSIGTIRDQSTCGSCWAFGATEAMTDRLCIHSNASIQIPVSAADLITCCSECGNGCFGGSPLIAWRYWVKRGIVSGGGYKSGQGCRAYFFPPCEHYRNGTRPTCEPYKQTPECKNSCDTNLKLDYEDDKTYGKSAYVIIGEQNMKAEILKNGPIEATFAVFADFLQYQGGVYKHVAGKMLGGHAVKIIGWGVENSVPYWLVANSWNEDWGEHGYFKILRGKNECGIESQATAGLPKIF